MTREITVDTWSVRSDRGNGREQFVAGEPADQWQGEEGLVITMSVKRVHMIGQTRRALNWTTEEHLILNGEDLGTPVHVWGGGGMYWRCQPHVALRIMGRTPGVVPPETLNQRRALRDSFGAPRIVPADQWDGPVGLPPGGSIGPDDDGSEVVVWHTSAFPMSFVGRNGVWRWKPEPATPHLFNGRVIVTRADAIDELRAVFEEEGIFRNNYFLMKFVLEHSQGWWTGECWRANRSRWSYLRQAYKDEMRRLSDLCVALA